MSTIEAADAAGMATTRRISAIVSGSAGVIDVALAKLLTLVTEA